MPLRNRLALCFSALLAITATAFWLTFQNELRNSLDQHMEVLGDSLSAQAAASMREFVLVNDVLALNVALNQLARDENIIHVTVYDVDNNQLPSAAETAISAAPIRMRKEFRYRESEKTVRLLLQDFEREILSQKPTKPLSMDIQI